MPTYEYVCRDCATPLEVVQSIHEPALTQCPSCGGSLRKVFGNVGVVFKGSGFYRTDSRSKSKSGSAGSGSSSPAAKPAAATKSPESTSSSQTPSQAPSGDSAATKAAPKSAPSKAS